MALAIFLPLHFLALGTALEGAAALDGFLALTHHPLVRLAEWGLVVLLALHLLLGIRVLTLELLPWRGIGRGWIALGLGLALATGLLFVAAQLI